MVDIQSAKAEIRRGRKRRRRNHGMKIKCPHLLRRAAIIVLLCCKTMQSRLREQHLPSMLAHYTQENQEPVVPYRTKMGQERLNSLSQLCIEADMLHSVDYKNLP